MTRSSDTPTQPEMLRHLSRELPLTNSHAMATKVIEDIRFLSDRIERIKKLHTPNSTVLKTYESMLASREAVLQWLRENGELNEEQELDKNQVAS